MSDMSIEQWKTFLRARLLQESGKDAEALDVFNKLATSFPSNPHLQASRAFALERLNRGDEAASARIASAYSKAAASLVGDADKPEAWTAELNSLIGELDYADKAKAVSASLVAW